jgi:hypothetical protein
MIGAFQSGVTALSGRLWTPAETSLSLWLDAADTETISHTELSVTQWRDKSGNSRNAAPTSASYKPVLQENQIGNKGLIRFPDANYGLTLSSDADASGPMSYAVVFLREEAGTILPFAKTAALYSFGLFGFSWAVSQNEIATVVFTNNVIEIAIATSTKENVAESALRYRNGASGVGSVAATSTGAQKILGAFSTVAAKLAEVLYARSIWDTDTRQKVEGYLAHKWGTTEKLPSGHPYKTAPPRI